MKSEAEVIRSEARARRAERAHEGPAHPHDADRSACRGVLRDLPHEAGGSGAKRRVGCSEAVVAEHDWVLVHVRHRNPERHARHGASCVCHSHVDDEDRHIARAGRLHLKAGRWRGASGGEESLEVKTRGPGGAAQCHPLAGGGFGDDERHRCRVCVLHAPCHGLRGTGVLVSRNQLGGGAEVLAGDGGGKPDQASDRSALKDGRTDHAIAQVLAGEDGRVVDVVDRDGVLELRLEDAVRHHDLDTHGAAALKVELRPRGHVHLAGGCADRERRGASAAVAVECCERPRQDRAGAVGVRRDEAAGRRHQRPCRAVLVHSKPVGCLRKVWPLLHIGHGDGQRQVARQERGRPVVLHGHDETEVRRH
mmetsp:Transcript_23487/g.89227  ORF Transcript_23487/g.89227 Transcript_23487/m.89227 type:complete len:365 (-) Transcript_23487:2093-3187(-)